MNIGIIPRIRKFKKNQYEYSVDIELISFIRNIFKKSKVSILFDHNLQSFKVDLLVISGGNDLKHFSKSQENDFKHKLSNFFLKKAIKEKKKVVGICYGAQFIADFYKSKLKKTSKHVGSHKIKFLPNNLGLGLKKNIVTNSFHEYLIHKLSNKLKPLAKASDGSIEAFQVKNGKILGIMWHPERNNKIKTFDKALFSKFR